MKQSPAIRRHETQKKIQLRKSLKELVEVAKAMREYIDAIPEVELGTMPGMDRDWVDATIDSAQKEASES